MPRSKVFEAGESVYALWPGSTLYYKAVVQGYDPSEKAYAVRFDDTDDTFILNKKHVIALSVIEGKTRGRSQSPSRKRTSGKRSRSSSRSRRQGRSRSPARSKKMDVVKKPAAELQEDQDKNTEEVVQKVVGSVIETHTSSATETHTSSATETHTSSTTEIHKEVKESFVSQMVISQTETLDNNYRRKLRSSHRVEKINDQVEEQVQEEKGAVVEEVSCSWTSCALYNLGLLALTGLVLVISPLLYSLCSSKSHCTILKLPTLPKWQAVLMPKSFYILGGWLLLQAILFVLPVGKVRQRKAENGELVKSRENGMIAFVVSLAIALGLPYSPKGRELSTYVKNEYFSILVVSIVCSVILALLTLIFSKSDGTRINLAKFLFGKKWCPSGGTHDWKLFGFVRAGFLLMVPLTASFVVNTYKNPRDIDPALAITGVSHLVLCAFYLFVEEFVVMSKDFKEYDMGLFAFVGSLAWIPFTFLSQIRYITYFHSKSTPLQLAGIGLLTAFGTYLFIVSNYQKMKYRHNPNQECFAGANVIVTPDGRNLLCHGWWGRLRHPNYLADILMSISWSLPCGITHIMPWMYPLFVVTFLLVRAVLDDRDCAKKHGDAWTQYKQAVPYCLVPFVY